MPFSSVLGASSAIRPGVCTSTTRPTVPYEGQLIYETDTDRIAAYNGSAWVYTHSSGLVLITSGSFTTVTSVSLPNSTFTSTYLNYKLIFNVTAVTSDADFTMRMRASGTDDSTTNYRDCHMTADSSGNYSAVTGGTTAWLVGESDATIIRYSFVADIMQPQTANITNLFFTYTYVNKAANEQFASTGSLSFITTTQFDSLSFISSVASSISGNYRVYGYANS